MLAPIVAFVYNRADHAREMLESLAKCKYAKLSDLYIFSDGPKNEAAKEKVFAVREIIHESWVKDSFGNVIVTEAETNKGLAHSVIEGVDSIIKKYGKVIVIEDDNVVSDQLISYMNKCLDAYANDDSVWSISGYSPFDNVVDADEDVYFSGRPNSYLWGTWLDRWELVDWKVQSYNNFRFNLIKRHSFNKYGNDASGMLDDQMVGKIDSWAIRFHYSCFENKRFVVMPNRTFSINKGNDGSGTHLKTVGEKDTRTMKEKEKEYMFSSPSESRRVIDMYNKKTHRKLSFRVYMYIKNAVFQGGVRR